MARISRSTKGRIYHGKINYYVIGGQYEYICYGGTPTLIGAKRLANRCGTLWDNWRGWNLPAIYRAEDTIEVESRNAITTPDGVLIRIPRLDAVPVWVDGHAIEEV